MATEHFPGGGRGSTAHSPDLDWSQVRETVLMLELASMQIETAMGEGEHSVQVLAGGFMEMAERLQGIRAALAELPATPELAAARAALLDDAGAMQEQVRASVLAFQFYDKLAQRLGHVCRGLEGLAALVEDRGRLFQPESWVALQTQLRSLYATREERAVFDAVLAGMPVREALAAQPASGPAGGGEVELF